MRILGSVVAPSATLVAIRQPKIAGRCGVRSQIIREELIWDEAIFLQQLAHESQRRPLVPPALDRYIEHFVFGASRRSTLLSSVVCKVVVDDAVEAGIGL